MEFIAIQVFSLDSKTQLRSYSTYARFDYITVGIYSSNVTNYDCRLYNFL